MTKLRKIIRFFNDLMLVDVIKDRYLYDTVTLVPGITNVQYFRTLSTIVGGSKLDQQANFTGDLSLVPEGHIFQIFAIWLKIIGPNQPVGIRKLIFDFASYEMKVNNVEVDKDALHRLAGGLDERLVAGGANPSPGMFSFSGDGTEETCRKYIVPKAIPGGRQFDFQVRWQNPGGLALPAGSAIVTQMNLFGFEVIPVEPQPNATQRQQMWDSQQEQGIM